MKKCLTKKIRKLRVENGLTIQKLAQELEIPASSLGMYERGMRNPELEVILKISEFFKVDIGYFYEESTETQSLVNNVNLLNDDINIINAKKRARGFCELCEMRAPFVLENGEPYLESFTIKNNILNGVVMLCPNCYKKVSILNYVGDINYLKSKLEREINNKDE